MLSGSVIPWWIVLPVAGVVMMFVAAHIGATQQRTKPPSRRRIRVANGWVMLVTIPLLAAGFGVLNPHTQSRAFALVWVAAVALLAMTIGLALLDAANTLRLARAARRKSAGEAALKAIEDVKSAVVAKREGSAPRRGSGAGS